MFISIVLKIHFEIRLGCQKYILECAGTNALNWQNRKLCVYSNDASINIKLLYSSPYT